jgi:hypothetical protein
MHASGIIATIVAVGVLAFALRWQFGWTIERATSDDPSNVIPVTTPFTSPLCGPNNEYCRDLDLRFGEP